MPKFIDLRLKNLQSHQDSFFNFHPHFNLIIGSTNAGKTSFVRAINFLFTGDWDKSFVRIGSKDSEIEIRLDGDAEISRIKGSSNRVILRKSNEKVEEFSGFGDTLPSPITNELGIFPLEIDKDKTISLNVSMQHDPLFLLREPGSLCAKILGRLIGLHLIDVSIRGLNVDSRNRTIQNSENEIKITEIEKNLEKYKTLEEDKNNLKKLKDEVEKQQKIRNTLEIATDLLYQVENFNERFKNFKDRFSKFQQINLNEEKKQYIEKLSKIGVCPTCGSKMTDSSISHCLDI